jgi:hypothetical protein
MFGLRHLWSRKYGGLKDLGAKYFQTKGLAHFLIPPQPSPDTKSLIMQGLVPRADAKLVILKGLLLRMSYQRTYG